MKRYALSAESVMSFLEDRPGAEVVGEILWKSAEAHKTVLVSVVCWGSIYQAILKSKGEVFAQNKMKELSQLPIELAEADAAMCVLAASISTKYRVPYLDCFSPAMAYQRKATLVTMNPETRVLVGTNVLVPAAAKAVSGT